MSLVNVAYASRLTWANQMLDSLEVQALTPMFGENPVEMGLAGTACPTSETRPLTAYSRIVEPKPTIWPL